MAYRYLVLALGAAHTPGPKSLVNQLSTDPIEEDKEFSRTSFPQKEAPVRRQTNRETHAQSRTAVTNSLAQTRTRRNDKPVEITPGNAQEELGAKLEAKIEAKVEAKVEAKIDPCSGKKVKNKKWCVAARNFDSDDRVAQFLACTTLLTCLFFYFLNVRSTQLRLLTWEMLNAVFSIISAIGLVMILRSIVYYFICMPQVYGYALPNGITVVLSSLILNAVLYFANSTGGERVAIRAVNGDWVEYDLRLVRCKALGPTFGRLFAFAQIGFWSAMMFDPDKSDKAKENHQWVPVIAFLANFGYLGAIRAGRLLYLHYYRLEEGEMDEDVLAFQANLNQFNFAGVGLMLSFMLTQEVRYELGGVMPTPKGGAVNRFTEDTDVDSLVLALLGVAVGSKIVAVLIDDYLPPKKPSTGRGIDWPLWLYAYWTRVTYNSLNLLSGWLLHYACVWYIDDHFYADAIVHPDSTVRFRFFVAFGITFMGLGVIAVLASVPGNVFENSLAGGESLKQQASATMSLAIAFSWRRFYGIAADKYEERFAPVLFPDDPVRGGNLIEIGIWTPFVCLLLPMQLMYMSRMTLPPKAGKTILVCGELPQEQDDVVEEEEAVEEAAEK